MELLKQLREMTGAGMVDCKKALDESNGDLNAAAEHLQTEVRKLLDGVVCENQRTVLKLALSDLLKN